MGLGGVLARLGRDDDALAAYRRALDRAPDDEGALRGRADALAAARARGRGGRRPSIVWPASSSAAGRLADACDVARRALELAESRGRRRQVRVPGRAAPRSTRGDPTAAEALERALGVLEVVPARRCRQTLATPGPGAEPARGRRRPEPRAARAAARPAVAEPGGRGGARRRRPRRGPPAGAVAAVGHRAVGQFHAAIDACYEALAIAPADPDVHLALAELYLDRGWRVPGGGQAGPPRPARRS